MSFSARLWSEITPLFEAVVAHPFNRELASGTLPCETFTGYLVQDAHYLLRFARALALASAKAPTPALQSKLAELAREAVVVERAMHEQFFTAFEVSEDDYATTTLSPVCEAYGNFLLATAYGRGFGACMAAVLPCFNIYWQAGVRLMDSVEPGNPYQPWIDTYADPAFAASVQDVMMITDAAAETASAAEIAEMTSLYRTAARYEWMFWDRAYARETWPV